ncbi:substrate-binding periplasmic protein [Thalassotalea euphylliae]|uniref:substrate-binding periplasmic protein n=1 Tax=Thalassotalea euphylliae TaxID=1655234 RepID=UPI003645A248
MSKWMVLHRQFVTLAALVLGFNCAPLLATDQVTIASDDGPPHMIADNNSGIDLDIVSEIIKELGYSTHYIYAPLHRAKQLVIAKNADIVVPTFLQKDTPELYYSAPIIRYKPTIFSLRSDNIEINDFTDLKGLRVVSFQGATGYFGTAFEDAVKKANYRELHDMSTFPSLLVNKRADVVVLDYYIFFYYFNQYHLDLEPTLISTHAVIPEVNAYAGFASKSLRDQFNHKLTQFLANNGDKKVIKRYLGEAIVKR